MNDKKDPRLDAPRILRESVIPPTPVERRDGEERRQEDRRVTDQSLLVELRALASTVRQCQRNGHPDLSKHLEALLTKLGA